MYFWATLVTGILVTIIGIITFFVEVNKSNISINGEELSSPIIFLAGLMIVAFSFHFLT